MCNFLRCWPQLFCSLSSVEHNPTWKRLKGSLQDMGCIPAVSPLSSCTIYEGLGFLQPDVLEYGIWLGFQSIQESQCPWPPASKAPVDNPHWLHQVGKWGEGRRAELCSLLIAKLYQKSKIKLNALSFYIQIVVHSDCNGNGLVPAESLHFFYSKVLLKVKMPLMDQTTWRQILLKAFLHSTGRRRGQRTSEELPWPSRGVDGSWGAEWRVGCGF